MTETPIELDRHRGMAAQKATDIRRVIADVEANAKLLRDKQGVLELEILGAPATSWPRYLRISPGFPRRRAEQDARPNRTMHFIQPSRPGSNGVNRKYLMQNLSRRHVLMQESLRLGVESGWYSTKVSGTFVSGPHSSEADCLRRIAEINPPAAKKKT